jgi:hypothetical protein
MISMQLVDGVLVALAVLVGAAIALSVVLMAVGSAGKPGPAPQGGIRPGLPQDRPDLPREPQSDTDHDRVLVLR